MKTIIALLVLVGLALPAHARHHRSHHHAKYIRHAVHHAHRHMRSRHVVRRYRAVPQRHYGGGLVTITTDAGPITVAAHMADKFRGFLHDLVASGYKPRWVGCYARGGHIRNSMHYTGEACDIDQRARNVTAGPMYHVSALARKWGLTDGCSFRDCGHISNGR